MHKTTRVAKWTKKWTPARIKALRKRYGETQFVFCQRFRTSVQALRTWEQGTIVPLGAVTVILDQLEKEAIALSD